MINTSDNIGIEPIASRKNRKYKGYRVMEKIRAGLKPEPILLVVLAAVSVLINSIYYNSHMQLMLGLRLMAKANLLFIVMYGAYFAIIAIFDRQLDTEGRIYKSKKLLIPVILLLSLYHIFDYVLLYTNAMNKFADWLLRNGLKFDYIYMLMLLSSVLLVYILQVKVQSVKCSFTWKQFGVMLIMGISLLCILLVFGGKLALLDDHSLTNNLIPVIRKFFYPALYEELLYRVLLLGLLLSLGFSENKANLIQAFFFALAHWPNFQFLGLLMFVKTLCFILPGFLFGKLYLKTKSLGLPIFLHGIHDSILMFVSL